MNNTIYGLDLAKNIFHLVEVSRTGKELSRRKLKRHQVLSYFHQLIESKVAMEACASSYYWAREFDNMGHDVLLLPPQHVKAYLRGQKNDFNDALAIAEAAQHGRVRPVSIKSEEQQALQAFHRIRQQLKTDRTRLVNQTRGFLAEYGIAIPLGIAAFRKALPDILDISDRRLPEGLKHLLTRQHHRIIELCKELDWYQKQLILHVKNSEACTRLCEGPGFGPVCSSAIYSWMGDGKQFRRGRDASAALGLVPRQHSSGDKERLGGITKRGDSYVRYLIINGARSVVNKAGKKTDPLSRWINRLVATRGFNKAVVALANKMVRIAWVIIARGESYRPITA
jgi:transposase